jgi:hypothetical protein
MKTMVGRTNPDPVRLLPQRLLDPKEDALDDLIDRLGRLDPFVRQSASLLVLDVQRNLSNRQAHPLSSHPGGRYTVIVYDDGGRYLKAYNNIHKPKNYIKKVQSEHPRCHLCYMLTEKYERKPLGNWSV